MSHYQIIDAPSVCKVHVHFLPPLPHQSEESHAGGDVELLHSTPLGGQRTCHQLQRERVGVT